MIWYDSYTQLLSFRGNIRSLSKIVNTVFQKSLSILTRELGIISSSSMTFSFCCHSYLFYHHVRYIYCYCYILLNRIVLFVFQLINSPWRAHSKDTCLDFLTNELSMYWFDLEWAWLFTLQIFCTDTSILSIQKNSSNYLLSR